MLSVLIPTYNNRCLKLAQELSEQIDNTQIDAEIIVIDDASSDASVRSINSNINDIDHCRYIERDTNIGSSRLRNELICEAKGDMLIFIDSDTFPVSDNFLQKYIDALHNSGNVAICGGIAYRPANESNVGTLRLAYGLRYDAIPLRKRKRRQYTTFCSANFAISRALLSHLPFNSSIERYCHDSALFGSYLKRNGIKVQHIDNPVYHDDTNSNEEFLSKIRCATENLCLHEDKFKAMSRLLKLYRLLKTTHTTWLPALIFRHFDKKMEANLLGDKPNMLVYNIYRLSYMCCSMSLYSRQ